MRLNIYPSIIEFERYNILQTPYKDGLLEELRSRHNDTHSFFRNGDYIYLSNMSGDDLNIGQTVSVSTFGDDRITSSLIKHVFFRTFRERFPITPLQFYPFLIESRRPTDDLIHDLLPTDLQNKIAYKKQIEIQIRLIETNNNPKFGFVINIPRKWLFNINCYVMAEEGFDFIGSEVLHCEPLPGLENVLAPEETFIGILKVISNNIGIVTTNEGDKQIPLSSLYLRKTLKNINGYLSFRLGEGGREKVLNKIANTREDFFSLKNIYGEIQEISNLIATDRKTNSPIDYMNKDGFVFNISPDSSLLNNSYSFATPTFIFDAARTKTKNSNADAGLVNYGPYDSDTFSPKSPKILAICKKDHRGKFTQFLNSLIDGLPDSTYFKQGLKKKYELQSINVSIKEVSEFNISAYEKIIEQLEERPDLAIIEIPAIFRNLPIEQNPYYLLKARLLAKEIPIQFIQAEKLPANEYILNAISLQDYAKMGGVPWVLVSSQSIDRELIIGIGHNITYSNSFSGNSQDRVVGITTFFSGDGQYLIGGTAKDVPYSDYFEELLNSLRKSFNEIGNEQGWKVGDTIRLIFHIFKPIKNTEFEVVSNLIREFTQYKIQFAFVTISKKHPYIMFDISQEGKPKNKNSAHLIGKYIPKRGTNIILDKSSCLIQMLGINEIKTGKQGSSAPLLVRIRTPEGNFNNKEVEELLFTDLSYIVQQIYSFTYLSWRSFLPNETPATMLYSDLMADLLGKLRKIDFWQPDSVNFNLKRKKWFL